LRQDKINITHLVFAVIGVIGVVKLLLIFPLVGIVAFILGAGIAWAAIEDKLKLNQKQVVCPACGSSNIQIVNEVHKKGRGCLGSLIHFMIFLFIWWVWIFVWIFGGKKTINKTKAICMNCGRQWLL
jgi:ribosomal protein S27AE